MPEPSPLAPLPGVPAPVLDGIEDDGAELLDCISRVSAIHDARIALVGPHMLDLMCALIRRGGTEVTALRSVDGLDAQSADLVVLAVPDAVAGAATIAGFVPALAKAKRALTPSGMLLLALPAGAPGWLATQFGGLLRQLGFSVRRSDAGGHAMLCATQPLAGHRIARAS